MLFAGASGRGGVGRRSRLKICRGKPREGSNPSAPTMIGQLGLWRNRICRRLAPLGTHAAVAQWKEHRTSNPGVGGSNPSGGTISEHFSIPHECSFHPYMQVHTHCRYKYPICLYRAFSSVRQHFDFVRCGMTWHTHKKMGLLCTRGKRES